MSPELQDLYKQLANQHDDLQRKPIREKIGKQRKHDQLQKSRVQLQDAVRRGKVLDKQTIA
eukprot:911414-Karenia_brevis.AAC.1